MPPSKVRIIEVEEGESVFLKVKSMYPITLEFQKGTLVAFETLGGIFTRFAQERPPCMEKVEELAETQHEEDMLETQEFEYGDPPPPSKTPAPLSPPLSPPRNVTYRKSKARYSETPDYLQEGETQLDI
jgi:hypothetical protein